MTRKIMHSASGMRSPTARREAGWLVLRLCVAVRALHKTALGVADCAYVMKSSRLVLEKPTAARDVAGNGCLRRH